MPKDSIERPVPFVWKGIFVEIVSRFISGDYALSSRPVGVCEITPDRAEFIAAQIASYGDDLIELSDETWSRSVYVWMDGYWEVIIDLCMKDQGVSDLALLTKIYEGEDGKFIFKVESVYVP